MFKELSSGVQHYNLNLQLRCLVSCSPYLTILNELYAKLNAFRRHIHNTHANKLLLTSAATQLIKIAILCECGAEQAAPHTLINIAKWLERGSWAGLGCSFVCHINIWRKCFLEKYLGSVLCEVKWKQAFVPVLMLLERAPWVCCVYPQNSAA